MNTPIEFRKDLEKIIILAQGPSWYHCPPEAPKGAEIWGSNVIYRDHQKVDRIFFGHDMRGHFFEDDWNLIQNLNDYGCTVYTPGNIKQLKKNVLIPIHEILEKYKAGFFLTTIAYMIATAILVLDEKWEYLPDGSKKPKYLEYYGVDMRPDAGGETYGNEKGCVEFWTRVAQGKGIVFKNTLESYILKEKQEGNFPGFRAKVPQNGLVFQIPPEERNPYCLKNYMISPEGEEI